jgi:spermidine/putrescine transport system substrate-binding protein
LAGFATATGAYPYFANPWYDPNAAHSMPYTIYKTGVAWRPDVLGDQLGGSWADLLDERARGHSYLLADPDEVLGLARCGSATTSIPLNRTSCPRSSICSAAQPVTGRRWIHHRQLHLLLSGAAWLQHSWSADVARSAAERASRCGIRVRGAGRGHADRDRRDGDPGERRPSRHRAPVPDYLLRTENARRTVGYLGYQTPVAGTEDAYAAMVPSAPACVVESRRGRPGPYFVAGDAAAVRRRADALSPSSTRREMRPTDGSGSMRMT